jgi:hypothetical protein
MDRIFVPVVPTPTEIDEDGRVLATDFDIEVELRPLLQSARGAGSPIRLVVCDALPALVHWDGRSDNSDKDVKQVLGRLQALAEEFECAIVGTKHLNKDVDKGDEYRFTGAQAWRESPRLSFLCERASDGEDGVAFIYVNKANDMPEVGTSYTQAVLKVLDEIEAETEDGKNILVTARRAEFGPHLMQKAKVRDLLRLTREGADRESRAAPPSRIEQMLGIVSETFGLLDSDTLRARVVWDAVSTEYGRAPNSEEKREICRRLGIKGERGSPVLTRVASA